MSLLHNCDLYDCYITMIYMNLLYNYHYYEFVT